MTALEPVKTKLTLFDIEAQLAALLEFREIAETPEEIAAADQEIDAYVAREVRKVDGIAAMIRECKERAEVAKREAQRLSEKSSAWTARMDRIKASVLRTMQSFQMRVLETPTNKLRVQANGGLEPLEIHTPELVPNDYCEYTITLSAKDWESLQLAVWAGDRDLDEIVTAAAKRRVVPELVRSALKQMVPCPSCNLDMDGVVIVPNGWTSNYSPSDCGRCNGKGLVSATVSGATLSPRGEHLRVE